MIDFERELKEILKEDPLGILKNRTVQPITSNQRLKDSFEEINKFLSDKIPKMWFPDAIEWVDKLPIGATGKVVKAELRKIYKDYKI